MLRKGITPSRIGGYFHGTLAAAMAEALAGVVEQEGLEAPIPLGGGVFQNEIFCARMALELKQRNLEPLFHRHVPTNDGGISLGQAVYAMNALKDGEI